MPQAGKGEIRLFCDFFDEDPVADTAELRRLGPFSVGGQGSAEVDAGVPTIASFLSGAGRITTTNEDNHTTLVGTQAAIQPDLMGPVVLEVRVQFENLDTKDAFIGFSDIAPETLSIETDVISNNGTSTLTYQASDLVGFYLSSELSDDEDWHTVANGGTSSMGTDATALDVDDDAVAGEWQILRLEIDPNGTCRWYIDEQLVKTQANAVDPSVAMGMCVGVEAKGAAIETMDVDYIELCAYRDWTV